MTLERAPHPIPYQGSKRMLAGRILSFVQHRRFSTLYEPFAGSAAISIAALERNIVERVVLGESLLPLAELWNMIIEGPVQVADQYAQLWDGQQPGDSSHFSRVRDEFNSSGDPVKLLYLLARCVKNAPRFNTQGEFNQSADRRRLGMRPKKMTNEILGVSALMSGRASVVCQDFVDTISMATRDDLVYLDPPWEGTSVGRDKRYHAGLERKRLETALADLVRREVPFLLSYDGSLSGRTYGEPLDPQLGLCRVGIEAGRSTQATLNGRSEFTVESLYMSPAIEV